MHDMNLIANQASPSEIADVSATLPRTRRPGDRWEGLSGDLIERFIDVKCVEQTLSRTAQRAHRMQLSALDSWMQQTHGRTLVAARAYDLREYLKTRAALGVEQRQLDRLLESVHEFYSYLRESGCRDEDPARRLPRHFRPAARSGLARVLHLPLITRATG